jgi:hypothetical protein
MVRDTYRICNLVISEVYFEIAVGSSYKLTQLSERLRVISECDETDGQTVVIPHTSS